MNYYLAKTDPETYSIDDLKRDRETVWDGVHNFQAIAVIKSWKIGDKIFLYHSQDDKAIVGLMVVAGEPYQNPKDPRTSWAAKVRFIREYPTEKRVTLKEVKETGKFAHFHLVSHSRLSTMACPDDFVVWMKEKDLL